MKGLEALKTNAMLVDRKTEIALKVAEAISRNGMILGSEGYYDGIDIDTIKLVETGAQRLLEVYGNCTMGDYFVDVGEFNNVKTIFFQVLLDADGNIISLKAA